MFGISFGEIVLIVVLFIIFVPPEEVPGVMARIWQFILGVKETVDSFANKVAKNEFISSILEDMDTASVLNTDLPTARRKGANKHNKR